MNRHSVWNHVTFDRTVGLPLKSPESRSLNEVSSFSFFLFSGLATSFLQWTTTALWQRSSLSKPKKTTTTKKKAAAIGPGRTRDDRESGSDSQSLLKKQILIKSYSRDWNCVLPGRPLLCVKDVVLKLLTLYCKKYKLTHMSKSLCDEFRLFVW